MTNTLNTSPPLPGPTRPRWGRRVVVTTIALLVLAAGVSLYFAVGSHRMDTACSRDATSPTGVASSVSHGWSWVPPGFTCTWSTPDGDVERTSLWW